MGKKLVTVTAHSELTVSTRWPKWSQPAVTEPWPGPWLSYDLAVTEPWSYWRCRDWAVTSPWLSCDLAVTELWPRRDWAGTSPSRDWAVIIGPRAVTTVVTVSSRWQFFSHGDFYDFAVNERCIIIAMCNLARNLSSLILCHPLTTNGYIDHILGIILYQRDVCNLSHGRSSTICLRSYKTCLPWRIR